MIFPLPVLRPYSLLVEDRNGRYLQAFLAEDGIWRLRTSPAEIPQRLKQILIRREDRWFYYHLGVNPFSLFRAAVQNLLTGRRVSGASTITMQIARMLEPKERSYGNKIIEMFRALQLECRYSKNELLEIYLSIVPLGGNVEGLKSAALLYYQTPLERLNIAQLFDLTLIPSDPNALRPGKDPGRLFEERTRQARLWIREGFLSREDSVVIWTTPAGSVRRSLPHFAPHFCLRVKEKFPGESEVKSSLDLVIQSTVERLATGHLRQWKLAGVRNAGVVVVENATREILAYAGSENFDDAGSEGQVDAVKALRSPGSTLKPLLFALCMDRGDLTPKTRLLDTPYDAEGFLAENYDGTYSGLVYADDALRRSLNVPMVRLLKQIGVPEFLDFVNGDGISSLQAQKPKLGLSLILGGCGVTLEEMTGAYASFPAGGEYTPLRYRHGAGPGVGASRRVFSPAAAFMVTEILSGLDRPDLPNNFESSLNLPAIAFKTGTSYGRRDAWSIGYSGEYTVGVWVGNVDHRGNPELVGSKAAAPLLVDIFNSISGQNVKTILAPPRDVAMREVCAESGMEPTADCTHLMEDWYSTDRTTIRSCNVHREFMISSDAKETYCASCVGSHPYKVSVYEEYPPELLSFWREAGVTYRLPPPHNPACTRLFAGLGPVIVSPSDNMTYYIVSAKQKLGLQASSGGDVGRLAWYIDDRFLGRSRAGSAIFASMTDGDHTVSCLDDRGRLSSVHIHVKAVF